MNLKAARETLPEVIRPGEPIPDPEGFKEWIRVKLLNHPSTRVLEEYARDHPNTESSTQVVREHVENHPANFRNPYHPAGLDPFFNASLDSPEAVISNQASWAWRLFQDNGSFLSDGEGEDTASLRRLLALRFLDAIPYLFDAKIYREIIKSPLPRHTIQVELPFRDMWMTLDHEFPLSIWDHEGVGDPGHPTTWSNDFRYKKEAFRLPGQKGGGINYWSGLYVMQKVDRINILLFCMEVNAVPHTSVQAVRPFLVEIMEIRQGMIWPDDINRDKLFVRDFLCALSFINSPYIVLDARVMRHQARRRLGIKTVLESHRPRFILLRTPLYKKDREPSHSAIDWKFRWLVRGHHRAQWCPSTKSHKLMWIAPYVKGPEGMPMKTAAYKVVQ